MADPERIVSDIAQHVRGLLDDANARAAAIVRAAEAEAAQTRERAEADAARIRAPAELTVERAEARAREILASSRSALDELETSLGLQPPAPPPVAEPPRPDPVAEPIAPATPPNESPAPPPAPPPMPPESSAAPGEAPAADDADAARLVAMKLALEGVSREDAKARLSASFSLPELDELIDQVYTQSAHVTRIRRWVPSLRRDR